MEYFGSSLSSLRSRVCTSGGISGAFSGFSSASVAFSLSSCFSLPSWGAAVASAAGAFSFGLGVPVRLGCSSPSPTTNSGSNSEGSGPLPVSGDAVLLSPSLLLDADRCDGERFREFDRLGLAPARGGTDGVVRCFACSSAIRASMAPRMRCEALSQHKIPESTISIWVCTWKPWNMVVVCYETRVLLQRQIAAISFP